jgi:hypothetical protein
MSRSCKYIKNYSLLPELSCPTPGSDMHEKDVAELLSHYHNPSLPKKFLTRSHKSVKKLFKEYCKDNNLKPDWHKLKDYGKDVSSIVAHLKYKHKRPRPKEFLGDEYDEIEDMFNSSFPSGHTAGAYFIAEMLSNLYEPHRQELKKLARLIGHSRIENGVHFPSDVLYGRFIGETLAGLCKQEGLLNDLIDFKVTKKDCKNCKDYLIKKSSNSKELKSNIAEFIERSNKIEKIKTSYDDCMSAVDNFLSGYELDKCTNDENIISHLKGIVTAHKLMPIDNPYKIIQIHKSFNPSCLDKGKPGEIRMEKGYSKTSGNDYASPELIIPYLSKIHNQSNNYVKHILYEWIHPFYDGNGRSGRIILLIDSDYDFDRVLNFCGDKYIDYIINYIDHFKDINKILHV